LGGVTSQSGVNCGENWTSKILTICIKFVNNEKKGKIIVVLTYCDYTELCVICVKCETNIDLICAYLGRIWKNLIIQSDYNTDQFENCWNIITILESYPWCVDLARYNVERMGNFENKRFRLGKRIHQIWVANFQTVKIAPWPHWVLKPDRWS